MTQLSKEAIKGMVEKFPWAAMEGPAVAKFRERLESTAALQGITSTEVKPVGPGPQGNLGEGSKRMMSGRRP